MHKRNNSFFLVGSKDETSGNQTCQIKLQENEKFSLFLRLPNSFDQKVLHISDIDIRYRKEDLLKCIQCNDFRKQQQALKNPSYKEIGQALNFRFLKDEKSWIVFISFELFEPKWESLKNAGCIGVDINENHLAVVETDRFGNPINQVNIPVCLYGKDTNQTKALIGDASKQIVDMAQLAKKPIILEDLSFEEKKATLEGKKYSRMLSSFAYKKIIEMIQSRAWSKKIEVFQVNPAYTSIIGSFKFAKKYGLTTHLAAALVIARRYQGFSERPPRQFSTIVKGDLVAFSPPVRKREKHVWSFWAKISKKFKAVLAEHFRRAKSSSSDPPKDDSCDRSSEFMGAIPIC